MISVSQNKIDGNRREVLQLETDPMQYVCFYRKFLPRQNQYISWHWHPPFEIDYIASGRMNIITSECEITLNAGDMVFINSNCMHELRPDPSESCELYTLIFSMHFLSGMHNCVFEQKYMIPVLRDASLEALAIRRLDPSGREMTEHILRAIELTDEEPFGFEFEVRAELCRFWCLMMNMHGHGSLPSADSRQADIERTKQMMQFMHTHYGDKILLKDIAAAAHISVRECTRCFRRYAHVSPIDYLNRYRIWTAAQMLIQTDDSVSEISENCGFASGSYFAKAFREMVGSSPRRYRHDNAAS